MQRILKQTEPTFLITYRLNPDADWDRDVRGAEKQQARRQLCQEQGSLCCFCEGRIRPEADAMKIAHFVPQAVDKGQAFVWTNLLGACLGGERKKFDKQHCDTRQGSSVLDPRLHPVHMAAGTVSFQMSGRLSGEIRASDPALQAEIEQKLNLNAEQLKTNRRAAADAMMVKMSRGHWTRAQIEKKRHELSLRSIGERVEYQSYLLSLLDRRLRAEG